MGVMVGSWGMGSTSRVTFTVDSLMRPAMLPMSLLLSDLVYLLCIESDNILDFLEYFLAPEEELVFSDQDALSPQTLLIISIHCLLIEVMKQIDKHLQHNLSDDQRVKNVDYAKYILVFDLISRWLFI